MKAEREATLAMQEEMMGRLMFKVHANMTELKEDVREAKDKATAAAVAVSETQEQVRALKAEVQKLKEREPAKLRGRSPKQAAKTNIQEDGDSNSEKDDADEDEEDRREREMVVSGLEWNTPAEEVKACVLAVIATSSKAETDARYTTRKMTSFGVLRFKSSQGKRRFKEWLSKLPGALTYKGKTLRIGDNETQEEQAKGRALSKVKRALMEAKPGRTDVKIDRPVGEVYVGRQTVARWDGEKIKLKGEGRNLKERIIALIAERPRKDTDSE